MTTYPNVALCGKMRSGKSVVAQYLAEKYGYAEFAFGDELKRTAHEMFDIPETPKPRELYQWWGQTLRQREPDIWVRKCFDRISDEAMFLDAYGDILRSLISDIRQPNEYSRCRAEGYVIIRVNAPEELRRQRALAEGDAFDSASLAHETEQHVDLFAVDYDVYNTGTFESLREQIDAIMAAIALEEG
ncbi:AAA family ATPase [Paenibacillus sp. YN15]|uniref:AAA family ATPase n=1 Tax=Paenibacillus sp. YN15 TaxID=1742774 RepID=UPI000DCCBE81|nr:AAA family ATPase [Paenibacillus sp. YN15]RAU96821.1 adenylate kinase [Paenibacillus sp. YN15]